MLNNAIVQGRLTKDVELRHTQSGTAVASFTLACERDIKDKETGDRATDFIDCVAWGHTAEFAAKFFSKGRMAVVEGRLQKRVWKDKNGENRYNVEINANSIYFSDSKETAKATSADGYKEPMQSFSEYEDDDCPF